MRKITSLLFALVLISLTASAQEKWPLQKCIDYALDHNLTVQQTALQGEIIQNNYSQSKLTRLPSLNGNINHNYNIGRSIDPFTNTFNTQTIQSNSFSLNAGMILYSGNRLNNTIKQTQVSMDANRMGLEAVRNQISLSVASAFLLIVQAEENLKLAEGQKQLTLDQVAQAKKLVESGVTNISNLLNLEAQAANDHVQIIMAQNQIQLAYNNLMNLMQLDLDLPFEIEIPVINDLPEMPTETVAELYQMALLSMPEVKQAELNIVESDYGLKIASSAFFPTLSAYGNLNTVYSESGLQAVDNGFETRVIGYLPSTNEEILTLWPITNYGQKPFSSQLEDNFGQSVGLSLSVPIFNGARTTTQVQNARINTQISHLNLDNTHNQLRSDITTAYTNLTAASSRYQAALISEAAQLKNYEFNQKRSEAGMLNSVDLLNAKNMWFQAQIQVLNAKYELLFRTLIIDFYKGQELRF